MASDVVDLRDFYRSALGLVARRMIRRAIRRVWPDLRGMRLLGIGYATPFLTALAGDTERTIGVMPASLGVLRWPPEGRNLVSLADEGELPVVVSRSRRAVGGARVLAVGEDDLGPGDRVSLVLDRPGDLTPAAGARGSAPGDQRQATRGENEQ